MKKSIRGGGGRVRTSLNSPELSFRYNINNTSYVFQEVDTGYAR
jgi:hypothetical protein